MNKGIAVAGNILVDYVKIVESYPEKGMLSTITDIEQGVGGCVPNTAIDLKKIDNKLYVQVFGKTGNDDNAKYVVSRMKNEGIDTKEIKFSKEKKTSFSDVITVKETGERTFFHYRGANADFSLEDIDIESIKTDMFHIGYLMLLDRFDKIKENNTDMAILLSKLQSKDIKTSIDVVSESNGNFSKVVKCALPFTNYVIINEIEAGNVAEIKVRENNLLIEENVYMAMERIMSMGVKEKVVVHCPECGFSLNKNGKFTKVYSKKIDKSLIKGTVGAGDAFCAGCLYSIYNGYDDEKMLRLSNLVAISCLREKDSVSGVKSKDELE